MLLETERAYFDSQKETFIKSYEGQFVLIHGADFLGAYTTQEQAYAAALAKGLVNEPVLIRRVQKEEPVESIPALLVGLTG